MISLNSCPKNEYFEVQELWFYYDERLEFGQKGLIEETIVFVADKVDENVIIEVENQLIQLTHDQADEVYGEIYINKKRQNKQKRR